MRKEIKKYREYMNSPEVREKRRKENRCQMSTCSRDRGTCGRNSCLSYKEGPEEARERQEKQKKHAEKMLRLSACP